jgi:hypothetical protein
VIIYRRTIEIRRDQKSNLMGCDEESRYDTRLKEDARAEESGGWCGD